MKVYVVICNVGGYECEPAVCGVFDTSEAAERYIQENQDAHRIWGEWDSRRKHLFWSKLKPSKQQKRAMSAEAYEAARQAAKETARELAGPQPPKPPRAGPFFYLIETELNAWHHDGLSEL